MSACNGWGFVSRPAASAFQDNENRITEHPDRSNQQAKGEINPGGNDRGGAQHTVEAGEQIESTPINSAAAAAAFKMVGSKHTGGGTGRS